MAIRVRSFEAAGGGSRWTFAGMANAHSAAMNARVTIAGRAEWLVANSPHAASLVGVAVNALTGPYTARAIGAAAAQIEADWTRFARLIGLPALQRRAARSVIVQGEAFVLLRIDPDTGALWPELLDPVQVARDYDRENPDGSRIYQGVEFDAFGRRVAYWVRPDPPGITLSRVRDPIRIDAADVLHIFEPQWPGQVRGLSWFAPIITRLVEIDALEDAVLARAKTSALFAGFIRDASGEAGGFDGERTTDGGLESGLEPGVLKILGPQQDITFPSVPDADFANDFLKANLRSVAAAMGLSYEQVSADLSGTNLSSIRVGLMEHRRRYAELRESLIIRGLLDPLWMRLHTLAALSGRRPWPANGDLETAFAVDWTPPGWPAVDPAKETAADVAAVAAGFKSRREVIAARGRDPDQVAAEIAAEGPAPTAQINPEPDEDDDDDA